MLCAILLLIQLTTDHGPRTPKPSIYLIRSGLSSCFLWFCRFLSILIAISAFSLHGGTAWALFGNTESAFGLDGRLSTTNLLIDNYNFRPYFGNKSTDQTSQNILRLIAAGRPTEQLDYEVHGLQSYTYYSSRRETGGLYFGTSGTDTRYRALDASWDWYKTSKSSASMWLDRFNLKATLAKVDIIAGRQPITFGKAYFWNPLDIFLPFDPRQFDRDYKAGVDGLRIDVPFGSFTGINLIGVAGRELEYSGKYVDHGTLNASWYGSAMLARTFTTLQGWDLAVQGGKIYGGYQLGGGLVGEIGPVETRAEAAYFWARDSEPLPFPLEGELVEDSFTAVLGFGHRFENTLTVEMEYFYNGAGDSNNLDASFVRFASGNILQMSRNLTGFLISYEFDPIITGQFTAINSWDDPSAQIQPILTWSPSNNTELILGASINFGDRPRKDSAGEVKLRSEFGTFPDFYFMEFKVYF
jgi:hypothetical protein